MMLEKNGEDHEVHFIVYANTKSLCCIPEANIMLFISDILIFLKKDANYLGFNFRCRTVFLWSQYHSETVMG